MKYVCVNAKKTMITKAEAPGRRERKKTRTRADLLSAAKRLFNRHGYEATSIEQIADAADVAVGTIYNYFPTKMQLLVEMLESAIEDVIRADIERVSNPPTDSVTAIHGLVMTYLKALDGFDRALLRHFTAAIFQDVKAIGTRNNALEGLMSDQVEAMLGILVQRGSLNAGVSVKTVARLLFNIANSEYYAWVGDDAVTIEVVSRSIKAQYAVVLGNLIAR